MSGLERVFTEKYDQDRIRDKALIDELYRQLGQLKYELGWLKKRWVLPSEEKIKLIDNSNDKISLRRQCDLLDLNRSNLYYSPKPNVSEEDRTLMRIIDEVYTKRPYFGRPRITNALKQDYGYMVNHKHVYRLMKIMGIEAVWPKPNLSKPNISHFIYPYLLKDISIIRPNHVWGVDITYIRLKHDWIYLIAIMD